MCDYSQVMYDIIKCMAVSDWYDFRECVAVVNQ